MTKTRYALEIKHYPASRKSFEVDGVEKDSLELDDVAKTATLIIGPGRAAVAATAGDLVYTAPSLLNSWANFVGWAAAGYAKDAQGVVRLKGLVKDGITAVGTPIFKLPVGYRPSENRVFSVATFDGVSLIHARIDVGSNGDVETGVQDNNVRNTWLSLDGISFVAAKGA